MIYDIALSFAGPDRPYVAQVAKHLKQRGITVFYDEHEKAGLWGKNLYDHLSQIYGKSARYCVVFISKDYADRLWTTLERQSAQARAFSANEEYILPARFDDTQIPSLPDTVAYEDLSKTTPLQLAQLIEEKLRSRKGIVSEFSASQDIATFGTEERDCSFGLDSLREFQGLLIPAGHHDEDYRALALEPILLRLEELMDPQSGTWHYKDKTELDIAYATSSVLTFLAQLGIALDHALMERGIRFLETVAARADVASRAANMFLALVGKTTDDILLPFLQSLKTRQIGDSRSVNFGSFLLEQEQLGAQAADTTSAWEEATYHKNGASFHGCHVADFLLHCEPASHDARRVRDELIAGLRQFFERSFRVHDGVLLDRSGTPSSVTLYGYAVAHRLGVGLPREWRELARTMIAQLEKQDNLFFRCLGITNVYYIYYSTRDELFRSEHKDYVHREQRHLFNELSTFLPSARDLAIFGRAMIYGACLESPSWQLVAQQRLRQLGLV